MWEQYSHVKKFLSEAEPFLQSKATCGKVKKTQEMPWISNTDQLWHTGKALETLA